MKERAPSFTVWAPDGTELKSGEFAGKTLLVVAGERGFVRDIVLWVQFIRTRYGEPDGKHALLAVIERAAPGVRGDLAPLLPGTPEFHVEPRDKQMERALRKLSELRRWERVLRKRGSGGAERVGRKASRLDEWINKQPPSFRRAFGLVGEGPHVIAVGPDGTLVFLIDGPLDERRGRELAAAVDPLLRPQAEPQRSGR